MGTRFSPVLIDEVQTPFEAHCHSVRRREKMVSKDKNSQSFCILTLQSRWFQEKHTRRKNQLTTLNQTPFEAPFYLKHRTSVEETSEENSRIQKLTNIIHQSLKRVSMSFKRVKI